MDKALSKPDINGDNDDVVSDAGSCFEDDGGGISAGSSYDHDLNLDLNVAPAFSSVTSPRGVQISRKFRFEEELLVEL
ncbi:hypothetical protein JRO89_XS11G0016000 [Xanthoceras sorbifolium]|uniref:Uncharacterized protein n=1 Tax=Xanthoceras sorbifolium TaxID=99658 RepID=A0ABQ8HEB2_9ROSI|nr:hypothetical protein JRO89_XS11G0016000 [Xanthoceras sorbifolium]